MNFHLGVILLVDDEPVLLRLMQLVLERKGYSVLTTDSGKKALCFLTTEHIDLIVTDLMMPKMGGAELVERARRITEVRILMISSRRKDQVASETMDTLQGFLRKPFTSADFLAAVHEAAA